jgi:hypothetical protein
MGISGRPVGFTGRIATPRGVFGDLHILTCHKIFNSFHAHRVLEHEPGFMYPIVHQLTSVAIGTSGGSFGTSSGAKIPLVGMGIGSVENYVHRWLLVAHYSHIIANWEILVNR